MNIIISTRNIEKNASKLKKEFHDRLHNIEEKYKAKLTKAEAIIEELPHNRFFAEVVLHGSQINLDAKAEAENIHEAITLASDRLEAQLHKLLDKQHNHR